MLGLFFATPAALLVGRLLGSVLVFVLYRRSPPLKTFFNAALICAETCLAVVIFGLIAPDVSSIGPQQWLAAYAAAFLANCLGAVAIGTVIAIYEGGLKLVPLLREAVAGQPASPLVVTLALVACISLEADRQSGWLLIASGGVLLLVYRGYAALFDRHLNLERLYHFSQAVTSSPETEAVLASVVAEAKQILRADHAQLLFPEPSTSTTTLSLSAGPHGRLRRSELETDATDTWLEKRVMRQVSPLFMPRGTREPEMKDWLERHNLRDAVVVPLPGSVGIIGMLVVGDRVGDVRTFDKDDVLLLKTVANHASIALEKGELIERLQHEATHDALTGLPNRAHLQSELVENLSNVAEGRSQGFAVMILDLDGFKDVNDTFGHEHGDILLVEVGQRLVAAVGDNAFVSRLGNDEFAVVATDVANPHGARELGSRLLASLEQPISMAGFDLEMGASVGVSLAPEHGDEPSILMKHADIAMHEAKSATRGISIYEPRTDAPNARKLAMVSELRAALHQHQITVHVQPQADADTGMVRSLEALARWTHPELGPISPDEFVPIAERSGLIRPLTLTVLEDTLAGFAAWQPHGVKAVAVNLSARSLMDFGLITDVQDVLERNRMQPESLILEITESAVMADPARAIRLLHQLHDMGVGLSLDDFGTGYSSLSYLKKLPVQEVKIDRSFVTGLQLGSEDFAIVRSIVDLGTNLGLDIVAEGVEDQSTWTLLHEIGCTRIQGWHLARPMHMDLAADWVRDHNTNVERQAVEAL